MTSTKRADEVAEGSEIKMLGRMYEVVRSESSVLDENHLCYLRLRDKLNNDEYIHISSHFPVEVVDDMAELPNNDEVQETLDRLIIACLDLAADRLDPFKHGSDWSVAANGDWVYDEAKILAELLKIRES